MQLYEQMEEDESSEDDEVVREMDVFVSHIALAAQSEKLYMLQSPLRAPWRPYDLEDASKVKYKPTANKLQVDIPLHGKGCNVDPEARPGMLQKQLSLVSTSADLATNFAIGTFRGGRMLLTPLSEALQLRPSMAHMDAAAAKTAKGNDRSADVEMLDEGEGAKPTLQPVKVNVQRRETERQAEMRLKSYSYHAQQESEEPWQELELLGPDSDEAAGILDTIVSPPNTSVQLTMSGGDFLEAVTPGSGFSGLSPSSLQVGASNEAAGFLGQPQQQLGAAAPQHQLSHVPDEARAALPAALAKLFKRHTVVNLSSIRLFLSTNEDVGKANVASGASDPALLSAVSGVPNVEIIRNCFVQMDKSMRDYAMKRVIFDLFKSKEQIRRADVQSTWVAKIPEKFPDSMYQRVIKAVAQNSSGNVWRLDDGNIR